MATVFSDDVPCSRHTDVLASDLSSIGRWAMARLTDHAFLLEFWNNSSVSESIFAAASSRIKSSLATVRG